MPRIALKKVEAQEQLTSLVERLGRGGAARRSQVISSMAKFGPPALPALLLRFRQARGPAFQLDVLEVIRRTAPDLTGEQVADLLLQVGLLRLWAASGKVRRGLDAAIALLQRVLVRLTLKARPERAQAASGCPEAKQETATFRLG